MTETMEETQYCAVHPQKEASLRCIRCNRLMCLECMNRTPTGYICNECARSHENKFFSASSRDYILSFGVAMILAGVAGFLMFKLNMWLLLMILIGIPLGGAIGELILRITGRRRGRYSGEIAALGIIIGGLLGAFLEAFLILGFPKILSFAISQWGLLIFIGLMAFTCLGRFKLRI